MILLDTDHLSNLRYPENPRYETLTARMYESMDQEFTTTVVPRFGLHVPYPHRAGLRRLDFPLLSEYEPRII